MRTRNSCRGTEVSPNHPPSHPRNSLSPECEPEEVKPGWWGLGEVDQDHHGPGGLFQAHFPRPQGSVQGPEARNVGPVRVNFLTGPSSRPHKSRKLTVLEVCTLRAWVQGDLGTCCRHHAHHLVSLLVSEGTSARLLLRPSLGEPATGNSLCQLPFEE